MSITKIISIILVVFFFSACTSSVPTPEEPSLTRVMNRSSDGPLAQEELNTIEVRAVVKSVDYKSRDLVLKTSNGEMVKLKASPEIKRLNEINRGDQVVVRYYQALSFEVRKPTPEELANPETLSHLAVKNKEMLPPGLTFGTAVHSIYELVAIDHSSNQVTLKAPNGEKQTITARYPENLKRVKVGDNVAVTLAEVMAIEIEPLK